MTAFPRDLPGRFPLPLNVLALLFLAGGIQRDKIKQRQKIRVEDKIKQGALAFQFLPTPSFFIISGILAAGTSQLLLGLTFPCTVCLVWNVLHQPAFPPRGSGKVWRLRLLGDLLPPSSV